MSINLLDIVKDQVNGQLAKEASSILGESESSVTTALGGMMPALLGSVVQKSATGSGAQSILDSISKLDLGSLSNLAELFAGGASNVNGLLNSGGGFVDMLLANKAGEVIDLISGLSGMKSGSTSSLLKLAATFLMSVIGNQIKGTGLSGLTDLLSGQKSFINAALPSGLGNLLNFSDFGSVPKVGTNVITNTVNSGENNWMKWLLPLLLGAALLYWLGIKGCGKKAVDATQEKVEAVDSSLNKEVDAAGVAFDSMEAAVYKLFTYKLSSGFELVGASAGGIESDLISFIEDKSKMIDKTTWFDFDRLLFDTSKSTFQAASKEQLTNVAEILKAFPKVKLNIRGYTDDTGDSKANLRLSTDMAFNVMNELLALGIDKSRLKAEGYGDKFPVGDNSTEEGRQQNRRISVRVTEK